MAHVVRCQPTTLEELNEVVEELKEVVQELKEVVQDFTTLEKSKELVEYFTNFSSGKARSMARNGNWKIVKKWLYFSSLKNKI